MTARGRQIPNERRNLKRITLDPALVGSVNTSVLLFFALPAFTTVEGSYALSTFCTVTDSATLGTSFKMTRAGLWLVTAAITVAAADVAIDFAITRDATVLNNSPQVIDPATFAFANSQTTLASGVGGTVNMTAMIPITDTMAGSPSQGIIRFQAADANTGGAPTDLGTALVFISYIGDLRG